MDERTLVEVASNVTVEDLRGALSKIVLGLLAGVLFILAITGAIFRDRR